MQESRQLEPLAFVRPVGAWAPGKEGHRAEGRERGRGGVCTRNRVHLCP